MWLFVQKRNLILYLPYLLQPGTEEYKKNAFYKYLSLFVIFIVVYGPILAPISIHAEFKMIEE